ncbi:MAG: hypothetical protein A3E01_10120 [Gammaproteobacteria bacterium RIFCSPHIGHO2_12_FULL_63_22]|nr:MAG: hypothetical protein A3E01_10120 [Gammaproteobacteria bacterium RIFCSPHIGHO2_12_FULL_63_22]
MSSTYKEIPLKDLKESKLNPRQHFDATDMAELTESVKVKGVLQPVLVRTNGSAGGYELVAGARRYRAALAAGLTEIPAMIRALTDQEALEIMVIENSQRKDVHPLEEAHGYRALMATYKGHGDKAVDVIAGKVGKSVKYVYDRVKLCALIPEAQTLFLADHFTAGHAILLARLSTADQQRVIGTEDHDYGNGGLFCGTRSLNFTPEEKADGAADNPLATLKAVSVRELQAYIDDHVKFDHCAAEPMLFPETVGTVRQAVQERVKIIQITHDHCVQPDAKDGKERIFGPMSWTRADGKHGSKTCLHSVLGVLVAGAGRGQAFNVCTDKHKCAVHYAQEIKDREKRETANRGHLRVPANGAESRAAQERKYKDDQQREAAERARWEKAYPALMAPLAAAVQKASTKATGLLAGIIVGAVTEYHSLPCAKKAFALVPIGTTAEDLVRHVAFKILAEEASRSYSAVEDFPKRMKAFGLDAKKILDQAAPAALAPVVPAKAGTQPDPDSRRRGNDVSAKKPKAKATVVRKNANGKKKAA